MKRRHFLAGVGVLAANVPANLKAQSADAPTSRRARVNLNGPWGQSIAGERLRTIHVPSSLHPSGTYELSREFARPRLTGNNRIFLHFDAVTFFARVLCNGVELGEMYPYVPFEFEITNVVKERGNILRVEIADLIPDSRGLGADALEMGINPGWEAYGGIIRDVWLETRPATFIENARLSYRFEPEYKAAQCSLRIWLDSQSSFSGQASAILRRAGQSVARVEKLISSDKELELVFGVDDPALWSPESPILYDVTVSIRTAAGADEFAFRTGFRDFRTKGPDFELNGERVVLNGVCRHDMWKDQGFTLTPEQMKADMTAIKAMGANYVRLVHYPHHRYVVDLADELGLLVAEEPGFWQVNFQTAKPSLAQLGFDILERTIRRDWNSPSVVQWLLSNECRLTVEFLKAGKERCRKLDPLERLVSAAKDKRKEEMKPMFEEGGMDFFDQHPYTVNVKQFREIAEFYGNSKPLMFTEWGGKEIGQSPHIMPHTVDMMLDLHASHQLAGTAFWSWQDVPEFSRIDPEMHNGILESGVVTETREPRQSIAMELRRLFQGQGRTAKFGEDYPEVLPLRSVPWSPAARVAPVALTSLVQSNEQRNAWSDFERVLSEYWPRQGYGRDQWQRTGNRFLLWKDSRIELAGAEFTIPSIDGFARALIVTPNHPEIVIPIDKSCSRIHILGHVSSPDGYPTGEDEGRVAAILRLRYAGAAEREIPLRHGYEIARGNQIFRSGRIDPIATEAQPALRYVKDTAREHYQFLLYSAPVLRQPLGSIVYRLDRAEKFPLLILAVSTEST